jgi:nucleotidyltransferase/DNA polymerase involved in DNA repair
VSRTILHVDMDAFYAAVEARDRPEIAGRPIVVGADPKGGRGRGVVAACNYEARGYGIRSAMPISEAYRRCPDAAYLRPRFHRYARASERVMAILERYSDLIEPLSIDEAFLDVTASTTLFGDGVQIARRIKDDVRREEGLTASVGVAPNKFLAKLASDLGKPDGLTVVAPDGESEFLRGLPVERLWGVGPKTAPRFHGLGLRTIGDVAAAPIGRLAATFGRTSAEHFHGLASGRDDRPVVSDRERKSLGHEVTFDEDVADRDVVRRTLLELADRLAQGLRHRRIAGRTVTVKLRTADFTTLTRRRTSPDSLTTTETIYPIARELLADADPGTQAVRLVGVSVSGLHEANAAEQLSLFTDPPARRRERGDRVAKAVDWIVRKFGPRAIRRGGALEP